MRCCHHLVTLFFKNHLLKFKCIYIAKLVLSKRKWHIFAIHSLTRVYPGLQLVQRQRVNVLPCSFVASIKRWFDTVINFAAICHLDLHIVVHNFDVKTLQKDRPDFFQFYMFFRKFQRFFYSYNRFQRFSVKGGLKQSLTPILLS